MSIDRDPTPSREQLAFEAYEVTGVDTVASMVHVIGFEDGAQIDMRIPVFRIESANPGVVEELAPGDYIIYTLVRVGELRGLSPPIMTESYQRIPPVDVETDFS